MIAVPSDSYSDPSTRKEHGLDLVCDGCGSTLSDVRLVEVEDPDGVITVCDTCEPQMRSTIVAELQSNDLGSRGESRGD